MKKGLVMEGGAMRGLFTAGVIDVMMEHDIKVDGAIGVSAGAVFGCNYKSHQIGRVLRYNTRFCRDPRYASFRSLFKTGNLYGAEFCYQELPKKLDIFDVETYKNSQMEFYVVCTDVRTGKAVYKKCETGDEKDIQWMRASASMPIVSKIVEIDSYQLLDGGIADPIPVKQFEKIGYQKNIIILTQPLNYVKHKNKLLPLVRVSFRKYPNIVKAVEHRHEVYNKTIAYIRSLEKQGKALVIRPKEALNIAQVEHHPEKLKQVYELGRAEGLERLSEIKQFVSER